MDSVWAMTHEGTVWFRKGIKGEMGGICEQLAVGNGWVEMSTKMITVSVAPNDQVNNITWKRYSCLSTNFNFLIKCIVGNRFGLLDMKTDVYIIVAVLRDQS